MKAPDTGAANEAGSRDRRPRWFDLLLLPTIALSLGASAIHFAVTPEHFSEYWLIGAFFAGVAWFQALWPVALVRSETRMIPALGIAVNLGTVALWVWTRVVSVPVGPEAGEPEAAGLADLTASGFELLLACLLLALLAPRLRAALDRRASRSSWVGSVFWAVLVGVITTLVLAEHGNDIMVMTH